MFEKLDAATITFIIANAAGLIAAFRSWSHSAAARTLIQDLVVDMGEDLKTHIVAAVAEGADQVIAKLPVKRAPKADATPAAS